MNKDQSIKILFVVLLLFSFYLLITGIVTPGDTFVNNGEVLEEDLQLSTYILNMSVGENYTIKAVVLPDNATNKNVTWVSGNPNIVTVNNGNVRAVVPGKTIIRVTSEKTHITKMINVTVNSTEKEVSIEKIIVEQPSYELFIGDKVQVQYNVEPSNANNTKISFSTNNKDVVGFDTTGNIVGVNEGEAIVTLKSNNGVTASVTIKVNKREVEVTGVKVDKKKTTLTEGETKQLTASVVPSNASNKTLTWASSNNDIVTVDNGKLKAIKAGTATVKVTSYNGKYKEVTVVVKSKEVIYPAITDDSRYHKGSLIASHSSETLKYRIQNYNNNDYVLVWVKDANKQWNSALPELGKVFKADTLLNYEISTYGYQNKGLVATNGGFFWDGWGDSPCSVFVINKGRIVRDIENKDYKRKQYNIFGITKDGDIKTYGFSSNDYNNNQKVKQELINDGVRSTFTIVGTIIGRDGSMSTATGDVRNRTVLCEVNKNNFVIFSGGALPFGGIASELKNAYGCQMAVNLDGGGSRKLYYKVGSGSITRRFGGDRAIPDMMYFVEQ